MNPLGRTAIVMSRLPRLVDPREAWLGGLRAALRRIKRDGECLIVVDKTAGSEFVRRGAVRCGIHVEAVSPTADASGVDPNGAIFPERDRLLIEMADTVVALRLRTNGNIHHLLRDRLKKGAEVLLVDLPGLQSRTARDELVSIGATCWMPDIDEQRPFEASVEEAVRYKRAITTQRSTIDVCEIVPFPCSADWVFLSHTTRACSGPWPDQASDDYIDSLLDSTPDADHSAVATLARIVRQRRLIATGRVIRGGSPVVCFTDVPLVDLPSLRKFQTHRTRWDFEPFGVCIRRDWLLQRGAKPVIYGSEDVWNGLPEPDRPRFQLSGNVDSTSDTPTGSTDWSFEREWRHQGDLDLRDLPIDAGLVFVPNFASAQRLSAVSSWPITLWPGEFTL